MTPAPHDRTSTGAGDLDTTDLDTATATGEVEEVLAVTESTPDLLCWLHAAVPPNPRTGGLDAKRIAAIFDVTPATVYRWIRDAAGRDFDPDARRRLNTLGTLRGHGELLWPGIDPITAQRHRLYLQAAANGRAAMRADPTTAAAIKAARPTTVLTYYNDRARVFGIATTTGPTNTRRYLGPRSGNTLVDQITVPDTFTATTIKYTALTLLDTDRCIVPRELLDRGRTEVWRRTHHHRPTHTRYTTDLDLTAIADTITTP